MSNILFVVGSTRPGRVSEKVLAHIQTIIEGRDDITASVADLRELDLPFFDGEITPSNPDFAPEAENVKAWTKLVGEADGVVLISPEYNHSTSAVLKNAIDWIYGEWENKPIGIISYGWFGGENAQIAIKQVYETLKPVHVEPTTKLYFMKHIQPDGSIIDEEYATSQINATLDAFAA